MHTYMDAFEQFVRTGAELAGETVDDTDLAVMRVAEDVYGTQVRALLAEDLREVKPELAFDPSRGPVE